ncbi:hypothetical protein [Nonomuraea sp. JJY05]|uniref:hypothetical protein n=1 Tax=Nonomuraea sp. JJY05 TaxID=3350255 RepID=UPI00373E528B
MVLVDVADFAQPSGRRGGRPRMDAHGLPSAHLVCHSAGGLLGRFVAVERLEWVRSL